MENTIGNKKNKKWKGNSGKQIGNEEYNKEMNNK